MSLKIKRIKSKKSFGCLIFISNLIHMIKYKFYLSYCVKDYLNELCSNSPLRIKYIKCNL